MGERIEIKPNDQSWVGKKIRDIGWPETDFIIVLAVGRDKIFAKLNDGGDNTFLIGCGIWELYTEPKKKMLLAPAIGFDRGSPIAYVSQGLFAGRDEAALEIGKDCIWPAVPNADGFYEVEESPEVRP